MSGLRSLTQTYGVTELLHGDGNYYHEAWFWCRSHHRPELGSWTMIGCIRVGPVMREEEAEAVGAALGTSL
jgi:hypothetical protein